jgi:nitrite reductase/ring-hydroxylating ferredoxin subunit
MERGQVINGQLRCPMHGYLFDLHNGECVLSPEGPCQGVKVYALEEQDGMVGVTL